MGDGFRSVGATLTTVGLIAGQMLAAGLIDHWRAPARPGAAPSPVMWLGVALFVVGAALIVVGRQPMTKP